MFPGQHVRPRKPVDTSSELRQDQGGPAPSLVVPCRPGRNYHFDPGLESFEQLASSTVGLQGFSLAHGGMLDVLSYEQNTPQRPGIRPPSAASTSGVRDVNSSRSGLD